jgi:hypothetical protein
MTNGWFGLNFPYLRKPPESALGTIIPENILNLPKYGFFRRNIFETTSGEEDFLSFSMSHPVWGFPTQKRRLPPIEMTSGFQQRNLLGFLGGFLLKGQPRDTSRLSLSILKLLTAWVLPADESDELGKNKVDAVWWTRLKKISHCGPTTVHKDQLSTHLCIARGSHCWWGHALNEWLTFSRHPAKTVL